VTPQPLLKAAANFRAVAPYPAADGRRLRPNSLYRSGELSRLEEEDLQVLQGLQLRLVCDLRSSQEQGKYVSRWPDGSPHRHLDLPDRDTSNAGPEKIFEMITRLPGDAGARQAMDMLYRRKPQAFAGNLRRLFDAIDAGDAVPLLIHCHAGKDRTGFIVAMLLAALGVRRTDIIEDYVATAQFFQVEVESAAMVGWAQRSFGHVLDPESVVPLVEARPEFLEASLAAIEAGWGGTERYLREAVGLTDAQRDRLRDVLLEPSPV
jgi:protein-tyrosine phosphatase